MFDTDSESSNVKARLFIQAPPARVIDTPVKPRALKIIETTTPTKKGIQTFNSMMNNSVITSSSPINQTRSRSVQRYTVHESRYPVIVKPQQPVILDGGFSHSTHPQTTIVQYSEYPRSLTPVHSGVPMHSTRSIIVPSSGQDYTLRRTPSINREYSGQRVYTSYPLQISPLSYRSTSPIHSSQYSRHTINVPHPAMPQYYQQQHKVVPVYQRSPSGVSNSTTGRSLSTDGRIMIQLLSTTSTQIYYFRSFNSCTIF